MPRHIATYRTAGGLNLAVTRTGWPFAAYTATCEGCGDTHRQRFKQPTEHQARQDTTSWAIAHAGTCRRIN